MPFLKENIKSQFIRKLHEVQTDELGKPKYAYAWKLLPTDKTPAGKREDLSLREKERIIQRDLIDGIDTKGSKMTLCQLYAKKNA